ncbi:MAG: penicillin-binding protein 2 [Acidimicrobiales bacterium]
MSQSGSAASGETSSLRIRATAVLVVIVCLFATLLGRLWYLQGVEASTLPALAVEGQGIETVYVPAPRGEIFDRDGVLLAGDKIEQVVTVERDQALAHPGLVNALSALLGEPAAAVQTAIDNVQYSPYQPVPLPWPVGESVVLAVDENQDLLPGVSVQAAPVRYYPYGAETANIIGYVSRITGSEYAEDKRQKCGTGVPCYQPDAQVGQAGVEASFEKYLRGTPGVEELQVDSQGNVLGRLSYTPPVPGDNLVLSISLTDQTAAVQTLAEYLAKARGTLDQATKYTHDFRAPAASMVVTDPRNGQVLALATNPDYNPDDFLGAGISSAQWAYYQNPANNFPTIDRAISTGYAPGSTWKLVTATAMLRYGLRTPATYYDDLGTYTIGGQQFDDNDNQALGYVDLQDALAESSDTYFYSVGGAFYEEYDAGRQLKAPDPLQSVASQYGLGHYSGIALPAESPGLVPDAQVVAKEHAQYPKDYPDGVWEPGDEVQEAIGEGQDEVTPLQLDDAYAAFGNGGTLYVPQIALAVEAPGTGNKANGKILVRFFPQVKDHVTMPSPYDQAAILAGLEGVVSDPNGGTAYAAFQGFPLTEYPVAGKTGTAQVSGEFCPYTDCGANQVPWPEYKQDTSVFASFAPADSPRFAVDAVFEQSGYGADVAAPAVAQVYKTLFGLNKPTVCGPSDASTTTSTTIVPCTPPTTTTTTSPTTTSPTTTSPVSTATTTASTTAGTTTTDAGPTTTNSNGAAG